MENMSSQYQEVLLNHQEALQNLRIINSSISSMVSLLDTMNSALTGNLEWLIDCLGGTKDGLHLLTTLAIHATFLFLATLCLLFVKAPGMARVALLLMATANAFMEIKFCVSMSIPIMTLLQAVFLVGNS